MKILRLEKNAIANALTGGKVTIAVYGLGKMGLPLAAVFAQKGAKVIGVDIDQKVVAEVNKGECPILGEPGLPEMLKPNVERGRLSATMDGVAAAKESDVMVILVPCLLNGDKSPDLTAISAASSSISQGLSKGDLVILETTVPPCTTKNMLLPILKQSGLKDGEFGLAFCPERTSSSRAIRDITGSYMKVVGGIDQKSTATAEAIYSVINKKGVITVSDTTAAEAIKLFEGIYRDVNIALSNELALISREIGVSPMEIFPVVNEPFDEVHQRYHINLLQPGAGVGGHCIPVYPYFVTKTTQTDTSLIKVARKINDFMPYHMVNLIIEGLNDIGKDVKGSNVLILGLAFRGGVKEARNSPAIPIIQRLKELRANVFLYDPLFSKEEIESFGAAYSGSFDNMDCLVIVTDHNEFKEYDWQRISGNMRNKVIVDGRQIVEPEKARKLGFVYKGIGCL
ncbi:MAG: nucleotide sugar dehydrogenase [Dehalococcoidia bacterium]|nr:nucleotide sugar dehydrogenase [Dehalococcoidia bacterium]